MKIDRLKVRRWIVCLLTLAVIVIFIARLMNIQIVQTDTYTKMLYDRQLSTQTVKATRGEIVDRNGSPMVINRMGYDVVIDYAFFPAERRNEIVFRLITLFEDLGETWNDPLPLSAHAPFAFTEGADQEVARLKEFLGVQTYATAQDVMYGLTEKYKLTSYTPTEARKIAGVRYEMEQRGFSLDVRYTFASDIDISSVIYVKEQGYELAGVDVVESAIRRYIDGNIAPHITGTIGLIYQEEYPALKAKGYAMDDVVGKSGVELAFEDYLRGQNGKRDILLEASGEVVEATESIAPVPGRTIVLTIDKKLQLLAQQVLEAQIKHLQKTAPAGEGREANSGAVVVINVKTGEVLAMATYPSYDLNTYRTEYAQLVSDTKLTPLVNRALTGQYTPGSIFKPTVALAGLQNHIITEGSTVQCNRVYMVNNHSFTCLGAHGSLNVINALRVSCNIFFYDVGRRTGIEAINHTAAQLGLGEPTGIEIPEAPGQRSEPELKAKVRGEDWYAGDLVQSSIGQMLNAYTPLQLANYAATIGNRGTRMKVTLVHEIKDYSMKNTIQPFVPVIAEQVDVDREYFETVIQGMIAASSPSGTASREFGNYPITVASKTGTPETLEFPNSTFICFAPADDPEIAISVVIEKGWHGYTGAPVARRLFDAYFGFTTPSSTPGDPATLVDAPAPDASQAPSDPENSQISQTITE